VLNRADELELTETDTNRTSMTSFPNQIPRRVLVVAYVFPPSGGAGVQRVTKFVRYLPEFGWECSVLTVANPSVPVFDDTLCSEIPDSTVVRRARSLEPGYGFKQAVSASAQAGHRRSLISRTKSLLKGVLRTVGNAVLQPDAQILWQPGAVREGTRLLRELRHDAIFVTAPPFSSLLVGAELSRRSGLPLIVDYRDEWGISNRYQENRQKSRLSHWIQARMQRRVLRQARSVVATTRRSRNALRETVRLSGGTAPVTCLYNGYDAADLSCAQTTAAAQTGFRPSDASRLRLAYVGTLWNLTSIEPIVDAICRVNSERPDLAAGIDLIIAGRRTSDQDAVLDRLAGTACHVQREGYVDHARALNIMHSADAQCLLLSDVEEAGRVVPAKTFEYLGIRRPILAVVPDGEVQELLTGCPFAEIFSPRDVSGIADSLIRRLEDKSDPPARKAGFTRDSECAPDWSPERFERRALTGQLAVLLNDVCGMEPSGAPGGGMQSHTESGGSEMDAFTNRLEKVHA